MDSVFGSLWILAEAENAAKQPPGLSLFEILIPFLAIFLIFQLLFGRGAQQKRERQRVENLLTSLKKNDPVETIGGILGTVANVSPEKQEVTIRVDDNTRIRMRASAISRVVTDPAKEKEKERESAAAKSTAS
ncbi:MAG: preprotein translocase subunit YajC [Planctomycetes bacterium]|nr:preprotein translocase subunit YajC [Planctomycetota bacterium]